MKFFKSRLLLYSCLMIAFVGIHELIIAQGKNNQQNIVKQSLKGTGEPNGDLSDFEIKVHPVTSSSLELVYLKDGIMKVEADIYSLLGKIVQNNTSKDFTKGVAQVFDISSLNNGVYIIKLKDTAKGDVAYRKVLIMK